MLTTPIPGIPVYEAWKTLSDQQKMDFLYRALQQVWGSLTLTGQQLTARLDALERHTADDLGKFARRIEALEAQRRAED